MNGDENNRWYDKYPDLRKYVDILKSLNNQDRDEIIQSMKEIILNHDEELIDKNAMEFPIICRRRWYDKDPYAWLVVNSLKYAEEDLITDIIIFLHEKLYGT